MNDNEEDYEVEDLLGDLNKKRSKKKKINSGRKGKSGERNLCATLTERFKKPFSRVIGSGARMSQVNLTEEAKLVMVGDIVCPNNFVFTIESKCGYSEIDLCNALENGHKLLDAFMDQAQKDANKVNKKPLVCWKKDRVACVVFLKQVDLPNFRDLKMNMCYNDWVAISLTELLKQKDSFFFKG
jgi:hypothetical protein